MTVLLGKLAAALLIHGGLQLLGALPGKGESSGAVRTLSGLGVFAGLAVAGFAAGAPLWVVLAATALAAGAGAVVTVRRGPTPGSPRFPLAGECLFALAVGTAALVALLVGVRTVGGDELYHLGRIRALLEAPRLTLADPFSGMPGVAGRYYLVPFFHLLAALPAKALGLAPLAAYDAVCLWSVLLVASVARHLARGFGRGPAGGAFLAVLSLQALWLPAVEARRDRFNYLFPFTPGQVASWLLILLLALALTAASERDFRRERWRPILLGFAAAALLHPSPLVLFFPWLGLAVALLLSTDRFRLGDARALLVRLAPLVLVAVAYLAAVRSLSTGKVLENDFDPAATRRAPLHPFEAETVERLWFLDDHVYLVRPNGPMLLGGALAVVLVGLHLRRGGSAALAFVGAVPLFSVLVVHNPLVFPFVARALSYHFGLLYGLEASLVPGLTLPLLAGLVGTGPVGSGPERPWRLLAAGIAALLTLFSGYRILVARRVGQELHETVSRPGLWSAVERAGDRAGYLLCPGDTAFAVPAFTSMTPFFCNAAPCRPFYADYFGRRRRAEELLRGPLAAEDAARERIWGTLRRNDGAAPGAPHDGGTLVYQDRDYTLVRLAPAPKGDPVR